jgi:hypothetical protein
MARRPGGKAASRKARQRKLQRAATPYVAPPAPVAVPPVGTPDAHEAVALDPPRRVTPSPERAYAGSGSTLTDRERAEYHYVERDLRNIGILTVVMLALLAASWFLFNALGLIG